MTRNFSSATTADVLNLARAAIDFDGYGASDLFVGFFEASKTHTRELAETAVDFFLTTYRDQLSEFIALSSLHLCAELYGSSGSQREDRQDRNLMKPLLSVGMVKVISYDQTFGKNYASKEHEEGIRALDADLKVFRPKDCDPLLFRRLLVSQMVTHGMRGHCMLIHERTGLAYYAHDYIGFGVIALRVDAGFAEARKFLKNADDLAGFLSVIER